MKEKQGPSRPGKSPTKIIERPSTKPVKQDAPPQEQSHPEFIEDELKTLDSQEKPDPSKKDSSSDDQGDCACT
ncbi:MAG: hypothetical protein HY293_05250 [Planctomycetes bacterium]|nr:hypothetical protein [Planctomycetota bacterium]